MGFPRGRLRATPAGAPAVRRHRWRRLAVALALLAAIAIGVGQLALPAIATRHLGGKLAAHGDVKLVQISAFPAIELLWGDADSVLVRMGSYSVAPTSGAAGAAGGGAPATTPTRRIGTFLASTAATGRLDASAGTVRAGRLVIEDASLTKRGDRLSASGLITEQALRAALPPAFTLAPVSAANSQLVFRGGVRILGQELSVQARLRARGGALVVQPNVLGVFPSFLSLTVFRDPRVDVLTVTARRTGGGWRVGATATLLG